jgi:hypothetical protein
MISLKTLIIEGRYDSIVTELSRKLLTVVKDSYAAVQDPKGMFAGQQIYFKKNESVPSIDDDEQFKYIYFEEVENSQIPLDFYLQFKVQWVEGLNDFRYGGDAYNDTKKQSDDMPLIEVRFEIDPADYPKILNELAMHLRDILRHEIEHTTQSGWNTIASKYIPSDQSIRSKINSGQLPAARYFMLPKEIPAMIHGLYFKAKKSKQPFNQVVDNYLSIWVDNNTITSDEKQDIIKTWKTYLPKLGITQEL